MSIIELDIQDDLVHYHFVLERRISFLRGNSATGKTTFAEMVRDKEDNSEIKHIISGCKDSIYVTEASYAGQMRDDQIRDCLLVIDDLNLLDKPSFSASLAENCIEKNLWYLIITRREIEEPDIDHFKDYGRRFSYAISSVFELHQDGNLYTLAPLYRYPYTDFSSFDLVITEDTAKGYVFFSSLFKCKTVASTNGKSTMVADVSKALREGYTRILALFDSAAFGCHMEEFNATFGRDTEYMVYIMSAYDCFEEVLCRSKLFSSNPVVIEELEMLHSYANKFISWEKYFENLLERASYSKLYEYVHAGSTLASCYISDCNTCNPYKRAKCDGHLKGNKFEALLRGTKYEFLLEI